MFQFVLHTSEVTVKTFQLLDTVASVGRFILTGAVNRFNETCRERHAGLPPPFKFWTEPHFPFSFLPQRVGFHAKGECVTQLSIFHEGTQRRPAAAITFCRAVEQADRHKRFLFLLPNFSLRLFGFVSSTVTWMSGGQNNQWGVKSFSH